MASAFSEKVYAIVREIPCGKAATYGQIAFLAGKPRAARLIGNVLHHNPYPGVVPCHRVVFRDGSLAEAFAFGGAGVQRALLESEGVPFLPDGRADLARCQWDGCLSGHSRP